jgi:hypothetical protein
VIDLGMPGRNALVEPRIGCLRDERCVEHRTASVLDAWMLVERSTWPLQLPDKADRGTRRRIERFSSDVTWTHASRNIVVTGGFNNHRVQILSSAGVYLFQFGSLGSGNGQFALPLGLAVDPTSHSIVVTDAYNSRVQICARKWGVRDVPTGPGRQRPVLAAAEGAAPEAPAFLVRPCASHLPPGRGP